MATQTKDHLKPTFSLSHFHTRKGFTLIELVIVIALVGVLAAIFSPKLLHLIDSHRADAAAEQIVSHLRLAQEYTISQHITHGVNFDKDNEAYSVYSKTAGSTYTPVKNPLRPGQDLIEDFTDEKSKLYGVTIESANFPTSSRYSVEFDFLGIPGGIGSSYSGYVSIKKGTETRNIGVEAETGSVSIW
ncbi:prepilin-type N-terminal cleavage/methylation domain-containing protein [bacterium]|nr:prepilin-type N-terminal cleavage/methylation domain-containing protein [bacterium]